jgi:AN1-type zinc finger protein 1
MSPATECVCGELFCLNHRHPSDHACPGAPPKRSALLSSQNTTMTKEKLLSRLKEWSSNRKSSENDKPKGSLFKGLIRTKSNQANSAIVQRGLEIGRLRREAKGDSKITEDKRIYVHGEGPPNLFAPLTNAAQVLRKPVYFSKEWSNGKVLDRLADTLGVHNQNNRSEDKEKRLQLFHIESGTLLEMDRKFGELVKNGDTVVLARGW